MDIKTRRLILNGPLFTVLYGIYNYLLITLVSNLFDGAGIYLIIPLTLTISGIYLLATVVQGIYPNSITHFLALMSEIWKGTSIYLLLFTVPMHIISWIVDVPNILFAVVLFLLVPLISIFAVYNADKIKINNIDLSFDNLFENIKFIHISDVHIGAIRGNRLLNNIIDKINDPAQADADFVAITGDLADGSSPIDLNSFKILAKSKVPILFTLGNHDFYPGIDNVIEAAKSANITILSNQLVEIKGTQLIGIPFGKEGVTNDVAKEVDSNDFEYFKKFLNFDIDINKTSILLHHVPIGWDLFKNIGVDLVLSGHTHGGQLFPFNYFVKKVFPYFKGLFADDCKYLHVSEGIGTLSPPMRLGTTADMTVFRLRKKNKD